MCGPNGGCQGRIRQGTPGTGMLLFPLLAGHMGSGSNGFRSGQNRDPTGDRPTFVGSSVGSVWIWQYPIDSLVTASVGPKKLSVDVGSRSWSDRVGSVQLEPNIREISIGYESQSGPTGILLCGCGCHTCYGSGILENISHYICITITYFEVAFPLHFPLYKLPSTRTNTTNK